MTDKGKAKDAESRVGYALKRAQQALNTAMTTALEPLDLTPAGYELLAALDGEPGLSNAEAARRGFVTPQTTHHLLLQLEHRGLIERQAHPAHGRIRQTSLTSHGQQVLASGRQAVRDVEQRMLRDLPPVDVTILRHALEHITRSLAT